MYEKEVSEVKKILKIEELETKYDFTIKQLISKVLTYTNRNELNANLILFIAGKLDNIIKFETSNETKPTYTNVKSVSDGMTSITYNTESTEEMINNRNALYGLSDNDKSFLKCYRGIL